MSSAEKPRKRLPVKPSIENLRKQAKHQSKIGDIALAEAQHRLAKEYGCRNWAELVHMVETMLRGANQLSYVKYELEALPKAAGAEDMETMRAILASGEFTQHDLDLALAQSLYRPSRRPQADLLIEHGADVDGQYGSGFGPIVLVTAEILEPDSLQYLLDHGCDVTFPPIETKYGPACPMLSAINTYERGKNAAKHRYLDLLLQHGAYVPPELKRWFLAIHRGDAAALKAELDRDSGLANRLFDEIPGAGNLNLDGCSLLHMAFEFGERECADVLFEKVADINLRGKIVTRGGETWGGHTPVFHLINSWQESNTDLLEYVLERTANWIDLGVQATLRVFGEIKGPFTPLEWAGENQRERALLEPFDRKSQIKRLIREENVEAVAKLLEAHPELLTPNLWPEATSGSPTVVGMLLDRGLSPDECTAPRKPLHLAVYKCRADIVEMLLQRGADPMQKNSLNERPLDLLDTYEPRPVGDPEARRIRTALLAAGAPDDIFCAVRAGDVAAVEKMLETNPELISAKSPDIGVPPLFVAARSGRLEAARLLLDRGAEVDWSNDRENTPLWFACQSPATAKDRLEVAKLLLDRGADPNHRCEKGSTPLHFAAWRGPAEMVRLLLSRGASKWLKDDTGEKPVDYAKSSKVNPEKDETVKGLSGILLPDGPFYNAVAAIDGGDVEELKRLLSEYPQLARDRANGAGWGGYFTNPALLHFIANNPNRDELMPPRILESAAAILNAGAEIDAVTQHENGGTALALVASSMPAHRSEMQIPLIELLVKKGANPQLALPAAIQERFPAAARKLLELGAEPTVLSAAGLGDKETLRRLLGHGPSRNELLSAAQAAAMHGQSDTLELLLDAGVDVNARLPHPHSPTLLHQAAWFGHRPLVELLLKRGADAKLQDRTYHGTPAGWAHANGHAELAAYLQERSGLGRD